ncbi:hypothetical protein Dimus_038074 [Dionaea muscipula]
MRTMQELYDVTAAVNDVSLFCLFADCEPLHFSEASLSEAWAYAMDEEINAINKNRTWELVDLPKGCKAIGVKWVYKLKKDSDGNVVKQKARLVVKGYNQQPGVDFNEVFAPVARIETVRLLIALAAQFKWKLYQMDFKSAFLNGVLEEDVYVQQPQGYVKQGSENKVLKLHKALYGLKQAPRTWNITLDAFLQRLNFVRCPHEYALYVRKSNGNLLIVCVYVDDLIITGSSVVLIEEFKSKLIHEFDMTDLGLLNYYLGIQVVQSSTGIFISQQSYIKKLLELYGMEHCKAVSTRMAVGTKLSRVGNGEFVDSSVYRSMVGSLRYVTCTRPDVLYSVGVVCRFMEKPREDHLAAFKRIFRYLKGTLNYGLWYSSSSTSSAVSSSSPTPVATETTLIGYSDSDWGGDADCKRSTTGFLFCYGGIAFTWVSKLQPIVTLSYSESEYVAAASSVIHCLWLRQLLRELEMEHLQPTVVRVDNQSAIAIAKNPVYHDRSKHIDVRFHILREAIARGDVELAYVRTQYQLADLMTKALGYQSFARLRGLLGLVDSSLRGVYVG